MLSTPVSGVLGSLPSGIRCISPLLVAQHEPSSGELITTSPIDWESHGPGGTHSLGPASGGGQARVQEGAGGEEGKMKDRVSLAHLPARLSPKPPTESAFLVL